MKGNRFARYWVALASLGIPAVVSAQGFGLNEIGSCAIGRGYAATGAPCKDASVIYWNPAAASTLSGNSLLIAGGSIAVTGAFTRDSALGRTNADVPTSYVPSIFFNHTDANGFAWGLGVYVPYGLTSQWPASFPGRFLADKASIKTIYIQPNFAWKLNDNWMVGGGPIIGHSDVELIQSLDLADQPTGAKDPLGNPIFFRQLGIARRTEFARGTLKGSANAYGFALGIYGRINDRWTMGARYMSALDFAYNNGNATFQQVPTGLTLAANNPLGLPAGTPVDALVASQFSSGALTSQGGTTSLPHPDQAEIGFGYTGLDRWLLSADYEWIGWGRFHQLDINFANPALGTRTQIEDYNNTSAIRLGAQYTDHNNWQWRVGFAGVSAAAPDETVTPIIPEQDRANYTAGLGIPFGKTLALDASYTYVWTPGRRGRIDDRANRTITATQLNSGVYTLAANIVTVALKASF
ncbi:MAG TPA: outer membrane protein transport protein [Gemmatimonadaceae bacterium]|nr:outer membrane protein transport protein [Gemmatimonadaceae bacterium]